MFSLSFLFNNSKLCTFLTAETLYYCFTILTGPDLCSESLPPDSSSTLSSLNFSSIFLLLLKTQKASFPQYLYMFLTPSIYIIYICPHYCFLSFLSFPHTQSNCRSIYARLLFSFLALYSLTTNTLILP